MNTYLKYLAVFTYLLLFSGCVNSSDNTQEIVKDKNLDRKEICYNASYGRIDLNLAGTSDQANNSFLLNCAVSVVVPMLNESQSVSLERNKRKVELANQLLKFDVDVNFVDETKTTLLMSVVMSYLPKQWKHETVQYLIKQGAKLDLVNEYGKSALDLAKLRQDEELVKLLSVDL